MVKKHIPSVVAFMLTISSFYSCHANILDAIRLAKKITQSEFISNNFDSLTVPFEMLNGWIVISVNIKDGDHIIPAKFTLDSGAPTVISDDLATKNQFQQETLSNADDIIATPDGIKSTPGHLAKALVFEIGSYKVKKENTLVKHLDNSYGMSCNSIVGMLGSDILEYATTLIDFENKRITFITPEAFNPNHYGLSSNWEFSSYSLLQKTPYLTIGINGQKEDAIIDLGYNGNVLLQFRNPKHKDAEQFMNTLGKQTVETYGALTTINGMVAQKGIQYLLSSATLSQNELTLNSGRISFMVNKKLKEDKVNIGTGFLKNYLVAIDWEHKKLYLKQQQELEETTTSPLFMVSYLPINKKFCVSAISTDSKWYQKGIRAGDTALKINGTELSQLIIENNTCATRQQLAEICEDIKTMVFMKEGKPERIENSEEKKGIAK